MKTVVSVRSIEGNLINWYAIVNQIRVDYSTKVKEVTDNPMASVISTEGGEAEFKALIATLIQEKRVARAASAKVKKLDSINRWSDIKEFAEWWIKYKPIIVPFDAQVICSDDATAICLYRYGQFQVEIYLSHPGEVIKDHCHPGVQILVVKLGGGGEGELAEDGGSTVRFQFSEILESGQYHGNNEVSPSRGYLVFQHWDPKLGPPTSAAIQWKGPAAGPKHEKIVNLIEIQDSVDTVE